MSLFIDPPVDIRPPQSRPQQGRVNKLAALSLLVALTGIVTYAGLFVAAVMAHVAMHQLRRNREHNTERGRAMAIASLWISYTAIVAMPLALCVYLVLAYMALPQPVF